MYFLSAGDQKSKIKVSTELVSLKSHSLAYRQLSSLCVFTWSSICVLVPSSDKYTNPIGWGPHTYNFSCLSYLFKGFFSKHKLRYWGLGLQCMNLKGANLVHYTSHPSLQWPDLQIYNLHPDCDLTGIAGGKLGVGVQSSPSLSWVSVDTQCRCSSWVLCFGICQREILVWFTELPSSLCSLRVPPTSTLLLYTLLWPSCHWSYTEACFPHLIFISLNNIGSITIGIFFCICLFLQSMQQNDMH